MRTIDLRRRRPLPWIALCVIAALVIYGTIKLIKFREDELEEFDLAQATVAGDKVVMRHLIDKILETSPLRFQGSSDACTGKDSLAILIPYRNREAHLRVFLEYMSWYFAQHPVCLTGVFVAEQGDERPFNRGWLLNVAYTVAKEAGATYFVFHDVDYLPMMGVDYGRPSQPMQLSSQPDSYGYRKLYAEYSGGVTALTVEMMQKINGYSNKYWGWGGEDDDFYHRLVQTGLVAKGASIGAPPKDKGIYVALNDKDHTQRTKTPAETKERLRKMEAGLEIWRDDGLTTLSYKVLGEERKTVHGLPFVQVRVTSDRL